MASLSAAEITQALTELPGWSLQNGELRRTFEFADFLAAIRFVNAIAALAEEAGHHPDIDIRYNKVALALVTHDAGGITAKDVSLAAQIGKVA
jgi:4a-hydroxytetrahydrobiopterin dehydratase